MQRPRFLPISGVLVLLALLLAPSCVLVQAPHFRAHAGAFYSGLEGDVNTKSGAVSGDFNVAGDTGQNDDRFNGQFGVELELSPLTIQVSGFEYSQTGNGNYNGNFLGTPFAGRVRSDFQIQNLKGLIGFQVVDLEVFTAHLHAGVNYLTADLKLEDVSTNVSDSIDESLPIPVVGASVDVEIMEELKLSGQIDGLSVSVDDFDATILDAQAAIHYLPAQNVDIFLGYRQVDFDFEGPINKTTDTDVDLKLSGPIFGVGIRF